MKEKIGLVVLRKHGRAYTTSKPGVTLVELVFAGFRKGVVEDGSS